MDIVERQYMDGARRRLPPRYRPDLVAHDAPRDNDPRRLEFAWVAGFLDAEGYFGLPKQYERRDGSAGFCTRVSATQHGLPNVPAEVLLRVHRVMGLDVL